MRLPIAKAHPPERATRRLFSKRQRRAGPDIVVRGVIRRDFHLEVGSHRLGLNPRRRIGVGVMINSESHRQPPGKTLLLPGWQRMELAGVGVPQQSFESLENESNLRLR